MIDMTQLATTYTTQFTPDAMQRIVAHATIAGVTIEEAIGKLVSIGLQVLDRQARGATFFFQSPETNGEIVMCRIYMDSQ